MLIWQVGKKKRFIVFKVLPELAALESSKRTLNTWMVFLMLP